MLLKHKYSRVDFKRGCFELNLDKHPEVQSLPHISRPVELTKPEGKSD